MITVYVLEGTRTGKRYAGITNNLKRRLIEHRNHRTKGSQIIGTFTLLHVELFPDHAAARVRERFLKSGQGRVWLRRKCPQRGPPEAGKAAP
jgi:putative endonuclease